MGTRNLTMVINEAGDKKVAQYGQWDGYPSGVGASVLAFLKDQSLVDKLKENLSKVRFMEPEGRDKEFSENYDKNCPNWSNEPDNRTPEQITWFNTFANRDLADEVLNNIANSKEDEILLMDRTSTAEGDGWVEWCYIINFKDNTLNVHSMLDQPLIKSYDLTNLPEEEIFISDLEGSDDEES